MGPLSYQGLTLSVPCCNNCSQPGLHFGRSYACIEHSEAVCEQLHSSLCRRHLCCTRRFLEV